MKRKRFGGVVILHSPGDNRTQWGTMDAVQFFRFLPATSTHRYALTSNPFPANALQTGKALQIYAIDLRPEELPGDRDNALRTGDPTGKSVLICRIYVKPSKRKYFCFAEKGIGLHQLHPVPFRGALRKVTDAGRGCGGRGWRS